MIEIAPTEYWEQIPINQSKLYCFSLTIDGKVGWRLPTQQEYNHYAAIQPTALFQEQLEGLGPDNHFLKLVIPVRDLQDD